MKYFALRVFGDGVIKRHHHTFEPEVVLLGEFESLDVAVEQACAELDCNHLSRGVLSQGEGASGYLVMDAQELATV
ncbi:hypothetical protein [Vibrio neptunius]|uniref:hypothetical protein n=1 Tax=Vibrio neptunius TaxID=170651 RepID=UPI003CE590B0